MEIVQYIIMLLIGIGLGAIGVLLIFRGRIQQVLEQGATKARWK